MLKHFRFFPFIVGLIVGVVGIFSMKPAQHITYKYPTPQTAEKTIYKDKNGVCYKYKSKEVDCDKNEGRLKPFPLNK